MPASKKFAKDLQYYKFCLYGFLKNLRFFEPFLVLFFMESGLSFLQIGALFSIREIVRNIFEIPAGMIADSIGRRRTMIQAFAFYILSFVVFYFSSSFLIFVLAMVVYSFGDAFRTGVHKAMIFEYLKIKGWKDQKVHYYGHTRSYSQLGSAVSALFAGFIVFFEGSYRTIFLYSIIPYSLDLLLMISYPKALDGEITALRKGKLLDRFSGTWKDFVFSFKDLKILKAISNISMYSGYYRAVRDFLQPVLQTFALSLPIMLAFDREKRSSVIVGLVYFIIFLLTSFTSRKSGNFAGRFRYVSMPLNLTLIAGLAVGIISGLFYNFQWLIPAIVFYIVIYLVENLRKPLGMGYVTDLLQKNILATVLSAESQTKTIFAAVIAPLLGLFADMFGIGTGLLIVSGMLLVIAPFLLARKQPD